MPKAAYNARKVAMKISSKTERRNGCCTTDYGALQKFTKKISCATQPFCYRLPSMHDDA
jgi:hypothetical protein